MLVIVKTYEALSIEPPQNDTAILSAQYPAEVEKIVTDLSPLEYIDSLSEEEAALIEDFDILTMPEYRDLMSGFYDHPYFISQRLELADVDAQETQKTMAQMEAGKGIIARIKARIQKRGYVIGPAATSVQLQLGQLLLMGQISTAIAVLEQQSTLPSWTEDETAIIQFSLKIMKRAESTVY